MKYRLRVIVVCSVLFIFFISYKILQPEIENGVRSDDTVDYGHEVDPIGIDDFPGGDFEGEDRHQGRNVQSRQQLYWEDYNQTKKAIISRLLELYDVDWAYKLEQSPWETAARWVKSRQITPNQATQLGR